MTKRSGESLIPLMFHVALVSWYWWAGVGSIVAWGWQSSGAAGEQFPFKILILNELPEFQTAVIVIYWRMGKSW